MTNDISVHSSVNNNNASDNLQLVEDIAKIQIKKDEIKKGIRRDIDITKNEIGIYNINDTVMIDNILTILDVCSVFNIQKVMLARNDVEKYYKARNRDSIKTVYKILSKITQDREKYKIDIQALIHRLYKYIYALDMPSLSQFCYQVCTSKDKILELAKDDIILSECINMIDIKCINTIIMYVTDLLVTDIGNDKRLDLYSVERLASELKISSKEILRLAKSNDYLSELLDRFDDITYSSLERQALSDKVNASFARDKLKLKKWTQMAVDNEQINLKFDDIIDI